MPRMMVDTIHADVGHVPKHAPVVAGYLTGTPDIRWTSRDWQRFKGRKIHIAQNYTEALALLSALDVIDIESGAFTIPQAIDIITQRARLKLRTCAYISASGLAELEAAIKTAALVEWVDYWVANWSLSLAEAGGLLGHRGIVAIQYASPTSNPMTPIPGGVIMLRQANVDLSVIADTWMASHPTTQKRKPQVKVHPKVAGSTLGAAIAGAILALLHGKGVHLNGTEGTVVSAAGALLAGLAAPNRRNT